MFITTLCYWSCRANFNLFETDSSSDFNTNKIIDIIKNHVDLSPNGIKTHSMDQPIYEATSSYGHLKRICTKTGSFSWEKLI